MTVLFVFLLRPVIMRTMNQALCVHFDTFLFSHLHFLFFSSFQTLSADKEGLVKLKNAVKDICKAGNSKLQIATWRSRSTN